MHVWRSEDNLSLSNMWVPGTEQTARLEGCIYLLSHFAGLTDFPRISKLPSIARALDTQFRQTLSQP